MFRGPMTESPRISPIIIIVPDLPFPVIDMVTSMMIAAAVPMDAVMEMNPSGLLSGVMVLERIAPVVDVIPGNQPVLLQRPDRETKQEMPGHFG